MPSGSHSGSFGSHSSGGSSFGGSHHSGGSHSSGGGFGTIFFFGSRSYNFKNKWAVILIFAAFFLLIVAFSLVASAASAKELIQKTETDYDYYQNMITFAEKNEDYLVTGKVKDKFFNQSAGKWFVTYIFKTTDGTEWVEGYTFSVYSANEAYNFIIGQDIELAVNSNPITKDTDSIPMDYKNMSLEKDGEYTNAKSQLVRSRIGYVLCFASSIGLIALTVVLEIKKTKEQKLEKEAERQHELDMEAAKQNAKTHICPYCGSKMPAEMHTCPNCGANLK